MREYNFNNLKRGKAVIFNQYTFSEDLKKKYPSLGDRKGTEKDVELLEETFVNLKFDLTVYHDRTGREINQILENLSKEDHSKNDCLVIVVLSHGTSGIVCAYDQLYSLKILWDHLIEKCPSLSGKPKLFFIQTCRGNTFDKGHHIDFDSLGLIGSSDQLINYHIPSTADLLVMYSTYDDHASIRLSDGSWFIQNLCKGLQKFNEANDLLSILTSVCHMIAYGCAHEIDQCTVKQMPCVVSTLTKLLCFEKKNYDNLPVTRFETGQREPKVKFFYALDSLE